MVVAAVGLGSFALSATAKAIMALYGVASDINDFIDKQIEKMKESENPTISRTARVIEGAKFGFGIGYVVPIAIIAIGQLILGNHLTAAATVGGAVVATNPIAMTCAAVGAIYYGWSALSGREQDEILERLRADLEVGVELLKSIIGFVLTKTKDLLSAENIKEMKAFISDAAATFGKSLADVTGAIKDRVLGAVDTVARTTVEASSTVKQAAVGAGSSVKQAAFEAGQTVVNTLRKSNKE
jgi:hypothetical protein